MIYITGSEGYIGSKLKEDGYTCDLKHGCDCLYDEVNGISHIYHLAAQSGVPTSTAYPINDARQNILCTIKMIELANREQARLIFTTTGAALEPESPYGLSKKTCEEYIKMLCNDYVILRLSSVYGCKPKGVVDNFIRADKPVVYGDGTQVRDFVHVDDIIEALKLAKDWDKGTYCLGSGKGTTIQEIAEATGKEIEYRETRVGEKRHVVLDNTTPNWEPTIDVIEYVKSCAT